MTASNINASGAEPVTTDGPVGGGVLSDAVFRTIFVQSPEAISVTRAHDHVMVEVNQEWLNLTGFSRAQVLGRTAVDIGLWPTESAREQALAPLGAEGRLCDADHGKRRAPLGALECHTGRCARRRLCIDLSA